MSAAASRKTGSVASRLRRAAAPPRTAAFAKSAPLFAALGDAGRLRLVARLCDGGPASIATLAQGATVTRQAITKHLRTLEDAGLVRSERLGRETVWELRTARLEEIRRQMEQISGRWDAALARLRNLVEGQD